MRFKVITNMEVQTSEGSTTLKEDQVIKLSKEEAIPLIQDGLIQPIEKVAYKVYSDILQAYLWVVDTDEDMQSQRSQGNAEAIYTHKEIATLRKLPKEYLKEIHQIKRVFPMSTIEEIINKVNFGN